jgi:pantothenate kinase
VLCKFKFSRHNGVMQTTLSSLTKHIHALHATRKQRIIVALAGAPGSGKSTAAEALCAQLGNAAILPMDGYHFDDGLLKDMGRLAFKGAPDTFDVGGYAQTLKRLRANDEATVAVPVFDRALEISRGSARLIPQAVPIIVTEGNYLLLDAEPWKGLRSLFDVTVKVDASLETLRDRLLARWRGFGLPESDVVRKTEENDLPNARYVVENSGDADFIISS